MRFTRKEYGSARLPPGKPMRTIGELAEEFGIPLASLRSLIRWNGGPKPLKTGCSKALSGRKVYYQHEETQKWYADLVKTRSKE